MQRTEACGARDQCPICGHGRARSLGRRDEYTLMSCDNCAHSYVRPTPSREELERLYSRYSYDGAGSLDQMPQFLVPLQQQIVASFDDYRRSNRLLDVGFGAAALLLAASRRGWEAHGIEQSEAAVAQATERGLSHLHLSDFLTAPLEPASFDVVVMSELIEHLPVPVPFLVRARELLRPGGLLYLTTPHGRGLSGRLLGADWSNCCPPNHLHLFSEASMREALTKAGFGKAKMRSGGLNPYELLAWARLSLRGRKSRAFERVASSYQLNAALTRTRARRAVKSTINSLLAATHLGDGLTVRAHPRVTRAGRPFPPVDD